MWKKTILIKTNLLTIIIVVAVLAAAIALYVTNGIQNLFFACITPGQVSSVTVYWQSGDRQAQLSEEDVKTLTLLLDGIRLKGDSVRILPAESLNPQYRVQLNSGVSFDIACYEQYYIVNGRAYYVEEVSSDGAFANYRAIGNLYLEHLGNREYFPRAVAGEGA